MTPTKVLFVCTQMEAGGVQVRATGMVQEAIRNGIDASVVFLYRKRSVFDGKPFVSHLSDGKPGALGLPLIVWRLYWHMRSNRPSAVIGMAHYSSPIAAFVAFLLGIPVRIGTQTNPPDTVPLIGRVLDFIAGVLGLYTRNIAASDAVFNCFDSYPRMYRRSLLTIYNGVHLRTSSLNQAEAREKFGLPQDGVIVLSVGRLSAQKNHEFMLGVMSKIKDLCYVVLGDGELRSDLLAKVNELGLQDRVKFVAEVPPEAVPDFLRAGDIFAFPSRFEAFGLALVEAMVAGLPVVCSDHVAIKEVVGDAALVVPLAEEARWVESIERLAADQAYRKEVGLRCAERAMMYGFDKMYTAYMAEASSGKLTE